MIVYAESLDIFDGEQDVEKIDFIKTKSIHKKNISTKSYFSKWRNKIKREFFLEVNLSFHNEEIKIK